ncbi:MAG: T9SS type A sorting domain-containing protein [Bacteroidales bacterium]|nr:T9SS type A sorting domain-containing protein [Bacteroidales bacterium]
MSETNSVMILVRDKTVYIQLGEILRNGNLSISDAHGKILMQVTILKSNFKVVDLNQPKGKYWVSIDSENMKVKKSFLLK